MNFLLQLNDQLQYLIDFNIYDWLMNITSRYEHMETFSIQLIEIKEKERTKVIA